MDLSSTESTIFSFPDARREALSRDLPELVWLYFALCQFPIYLLPQLLKPLARRLTRADAKAAGFST